VIPNPDKPELTIEYSIENIQSFGDRENSPIELFFATKCKKIAIKHITIVTWWTVNPQPKGGTHGLSIMSPVFLIEKLGSFFWKQNRFRLFLVIV
jgi:hypothetical protein